MDLTGCVKSAYLVILSVLKFNSVPRIFVALFDYEPATMSPNPDSSDEELPFREGQLIKIVGEKDSDGFYWGEAGNRTGYVPCNMVNDKSISLILIERAWNLVFSLAGVRGSG